LLLAILGVLNPHFATGRAILEKFGYSNFADMKKWWIWALQYIQTTESKNLALLSLKEAYN
jgi:hypothetical protein